MPDGMGGGPRIHTKNQSVISELKYLSLLIRILVENESVALIYNDHCNNRISITTLLKIWLNGM